MEKRLITKDQHSFLKAELGFYLEKGLIDEHQAIGIDNLYAIKPGFSFIKIILLLGALLVGLGILSFIASNWQVMTKVTKFSLILLSFISFNLAGFKLTDSYPKLARSLIYIGVFIYGAGIFLIGQMFNLGGHFTQAFLLWAIGILPMSIFNRDTIIMVFIHGLLLVYINGFFDINQYPLAALLLCPLLYYSNHLLNYSPIITFCNNLIALNLLGFTLLHYEVEPQLVALAFFVLGLILQLMPIRFNSNVFKLQGMLTLGIAGLVLTFREAWDVYSFANINIYFTLLYLLIVLFLIRRGNLLALVFFCLTIFRFYTDTLYDFMPKSLFFLTGGLMLLGFGYYFEKQRKAQGGIGYEK